MIADALYAEMKAQTVRMRRENRLLLKAADGTLTPNQVAHYLANVLQVLRHTPVFLAHGRARALEVGNQRLAAYFDQKAAEEKGHDMWAVQDISRMSERAPHAKS